ncbi:MAG TPA: multicopper oxidase domain-containing protein [Nitrospiraceae bacterium]|nr:multicopper oxidase domain-containing protein [Nitrospiraceae bacterium]
MQTGKNSRRRLWTTKSLPASALAIGFLIAGVTSPADAKTHEVKMTAVEKNLTVEGGGETYAAWTFNNQMPGPVIRVTEGDTIKFTLTNPAENKNPHAMDFHAAELDFLKNYRAINAGETIDFTFVAKKPGVFFYHCGAPPMIQHVARGMFGAIIVDPKDAKALPKADREYVLVQSELYKNPNDVQAMFDRKYDHIVFNGGIFKYHPFVTGGHALEAKPGERVRIYFVNAGPNEFAAIHPIGEIWDHVYESGNPANKLTGVQTYVVGPGSAATFDVIPESAGAYPIVTHSLTGALRGAIAVLVATPEAKPAPLMPHTPWEVETPATGITPSLQ